MRKALFLLVLPALALGACGIGKQKALDEFAVARNAPLVIPPDYSLTPPVAGTVSLSAENAQAQNDTHRWLLVAATAAIAIAVAWWIGREDKAKDRLALGLVLGGALGNIVDRVRFGYVVDFLDLHFGAVRPFYVFNVADAAISIGVVILLLRALLVREPASKNKAPEGTNEHA